MKPAFLALFIFLLTSCGQNNQNPEAAADGGPITRADSLLQEVIDGHDVAMPKMKKLERLIKEGKTALDSLNTLPHSEQAKNGALKQELEATVALLTQADKAMHDWMNGFKYDSLQNNEPLRIQYLEDQKEKVTIMKDAVLGSIEKAEAVLPLKK